MTNICINNKELERKVWNDEVVVTFKDIDLVHERPTGTARRNFNQNKKHFIEKVDYFKVLPNVRNSYNGIIPPRGITLITESGYLMIAKSFTDDKAWDVQRLLVNSYFREKKRFSNQNQQLEIDQEYTLEKKTYKGLSVMTTRDLSYITGLSTTSINFIARDKNISREILESHDLRMFKRENKGFNDVTKSLSIYYKNNAKEILNAVNSLSNCKEVFENYFDVEEIKVENKLDFREYQKVYALQCFDRYNNLHFISKKFREKICELISTEYVQMGLMDTVTTDLSINTAEGWNLMSAIQEFYRKYN